MTKSVRGFTLVELMITITVLSILVLVTIPSVLKAVDARQAVDAGQAVVDLIEFAKVQAAQRNRAYQVVPRLAGQDGSPNGFITLNEGPTSACMNFNDPLALKNVRVLDLSRSFPRIRLRATVPADLPVATLCIKPDGRVLRTDTKQPIPSDDVRYGAGDARFILQRFMGNQPIGPEVVVVVPYTGAVRLLR
jgi:prepilin-type N-terminal cleavage/methylation domain-containing protein